MSTLSKRIVRSKIIFGSPIASTALVDVATNQTIETYRGNATAFQFGFFTPAGAVVDLANVETLNLKLRVSQTAGSTILADKTIAAAALDLTLASATWADGTKQHAVFEFSNAEMNLDPAGLKKSFYLVITAILADGSEVTMATGTFILHEDNNATADPPPENPGTTITLEQADARYVLTTNTSTGGNGLADAGLVVLFNADGGVTAANFLGGMVGLGAGNSRGYIIGPVTELIEPVIRIPDANGMIAVTPNPDGSINAENIGDAGDAFPSFAQAATATAQRALLGIPTYANLTAANAALSLGQVYYDESLQTLNTATA